MRHPVEDEKDLPAKHVHVENMLPADKNWYIAPSEFPYFLNKPFLSSIFQSHQD